MSQRKTKKKKNMPNDSITTCRKDEKKKVNCCQLIVWAG